MLGFGFSKLVVLALLIFAIWTAFKYVGRVDEVRQTLRRARDAAERGPSRRGAAKIEAEVNPVGDGGHQSFAAQP